MERPLQATPVSFENLATISLTRLFCTTKGLTLQRRRSLIQIGLLVLVATPILRMAFSGYMFAKQGDRTYVIITFIVLTILLYSLFQA